MTHSVGLGVAEAGLLAWECAAVVASALAVAAVVCSLLSKARHRRQIDGHLQEQARLCAMVEQMPAVMWTTDRDLRFTSSDGAALPALGGTPNSNVGVSLYDYFRTRDPQFTPIAKHLDALGGQSCNYEITWGGRTFLTHVEPLRDAAGAVAGTVGVALDISERKAAEQALAASQAMNQALLTAIPDVMFRARGDGTLTEFVDRLTAPVLDYAGKNVRDVFPADVADRFLAAARKALGSRRAQAFECQTGGGRQVRYFEARVVACCGDEVLVILRNITQRRQAEIDLSAREAELRALLKAIPDQIFRITRDGRIAGCKTNGDEYLVMPAADLLGKVAADLAPPDIGNEFTRILALAFETGQPQAMQYPLELGGKIHWFEARLVLNTDGSDQVLSLVRNITHLRQVSSTDAMAGQLAGSNSAV